MIFTIKKPSIGKIMKITSPTINTKIIWEISFSTVEDKTEIQLMLVLLLIVIKSLNVY